jgi:hypothetical protein
MDAVRQYTPDLFRASLPRRPYCTDDLAEGVRIRAKNLAESKRYIQPNEGHLKMWLVFDVDYQQAAAAWQDANLPAPTWIAQNPDNGHAHLAWGLEVPVNVKARIEPIRFAAAVEAAYSDALRADIGYSGLIAKNPLHRHWRVTWGPSGLYGLEQLAEWVDLKAPRRKRAEAGLGRNCDLFDRLRAWSYKAVRAYWRPDGYTAWYDAVLAHAERLNTFPVPLPYSEVKATAKSVAKWTWRRFTPSGFRASQAARASRKGKGKREVGQALLTDGWTAKAVAEAVNADISTVYKWKKALAVERAENRANPLKDKAHPSNSGNAISDKSLQASGGQTVRNIRLPSTAAFFESDDSQAFNPKQVNHG